MFQPESPRDDKYPHRGSNQRNCDQSEIEGTEEIRNVFVMSKGKRTDYYVDVMGMTLKDRIILISEIMMKYDTYNVVPFILQENGEWVLNP